MKFEIKKNIILESLSNVTKALSQKVTIPVLNGIYIDATNEGIELLASDSELTIKNIIPIKEVTNLEKEGKVIIQSRYILDIIRKMPEDVITFESQDNNIKIYSSTNEYLLNCYNLSEYPKLELSESKNKLTLKADDLKSIISSTSYAMSVQEVRPILTGLNFKIAGDMLECTATDSYRLAKKTLKLKNTLDDAINIVIPGKTVNNLVSLLDNKEDVEINFFNNKVLFKFGNIMMQSSLLSGKYPDTSNYIPKEFKYIINLDLNKYYDAIDRASIITFSKDKNIVKMVIDNKKMTILGSSVESGKTKEELSIDANNKEKIEVSFSSKYMMEALKVLPGDNIILQINTDDKPIILNAVEDDTVVELILPIKTY